MGTMVLNTIDLSTYVQYHLTKSDQIWHGNHGKREACFYGSTMPQPKELGYSLSLSLSLSLHFNGHLPGEPGLAGVY